MRRNLFLGASAILLTACTGQAKAPESKDTPQIAAPLAAQMPEPNPNKNVYFGDLHIHTKNSFDAYIFNVRTSPDDVYRFAKGEAVRHPSGFDMKLAGPALDFVATTDHGAYMGVLEALNTPGSGLDGLDIAKDMFSTDPDKILPAFQTVGASVRSGKRIAEIYNQDIIDSAWKESIDAANRHYTPGKLTTFSAYEYTAVTQGNRGENSFAGGNLHRNVVFKDAAPQRLFATLDSINPEDLWDWLDAERAQGRDAIAIPHNSNVSDGEMFDTKSFTGEALTAAYGVQRARNEPIVEMTQVKGTSETHPALSPNDEFASFEIYEDLLASFIKSKVNGGYVREALARGMAIEAQTGVNPYKFGFIGSSDTHVVGGAFDEEDYWSKVGILDGTAEGRGSVPPGGKKSWEGVTRNENTEHWFTRWGASGFAAVWAPQNTREDIFDAMRARETYATTGTRITLRFFAGRDYEDGLLNDPDMIAKAYAGGVPMGGELGGELGGQSANDGSLARSPRFLVWAMRDPRAAPLQRVQIVKSWWTGDKTAERVYDVACSDGGVPDAQTQRCPDNGARVDLNDCSISSDKGAPELSALWRDPEFDPALNAAYYVRVLENPTCRWSTWDALKAGVERHPDLPATLQERAYSSPIWYNAVKG